MTQLTLGQAAKEVGKSKSTINRAIKNGRLSAQRLEDGSYRIDPSELFRVWPASVAQPFNTEPQAEPQATPSDVLQVKVDMLEAQLLREQETVGDLRSRLDRAEDRMLQLTHKEDPEAPKVGFLRRLWASL